ncbi:MAG: hypothetical protein F6J89_27540, partial [Symploca sp. SIO1C4]|nr:hypothetical protein [Symploca sp. SIO1C4]
MNQEQCNPLGSENELNQLPTTIPSINLTVNGNLNSGEVESFSFSGLEAGSLFIVEVTSEDLDPLLGLLDNDGDIITINDDQADGNFFPILTGRVAADGTIDFAISGTRDLDLTGLHFENGDYSLSLKTFSFPELPTETQLIKPQIINGGFESGDFTGWTTIGEATIEDSEVGSDPTEGTSQAFLSTGGAVFSDSILEEFLGLAPGSLDNLINWDATQGSAIRQTFQAEAGDILTFDWNFLTNEEVPPIFNDFSFVSITPLSEPDDTSSETDDTTSPTTDITLLSDAISPLLVPSETSFIEESGFQTSAVIIPESGFYTLGFGVVSFLDITLDSALLIDDVTLI